MTRNQELYPEGSAEAALQKTLLLLRKEKQEDLNQYRQKIQNSTLDERRRDGLCWYPVNLLKHYISTGEKYVLEVERGSRTNESHVFAAGKTISLFINDGSNDRASGVINWVKGNRMRFTLNAGDLPDWIDDGRLGIDLLFDEASYKAMEAAMKEVIEVGGRSRELRDILLGFKQPSFSSLSVSENPALNPAQQEALRNALAAEDVAIIHGPPGTGKTTTLVQVIQEVVKQEKQVLVCAPSNAAVDLLCDKLSELGLDTLRIGHPARVNEDMLPYTLDARAANHKSYKELKQLRRRAEELRTMALKYKRNFGRSEREQRKLLLREATLCKDQAEQLEYYITYDIFDKTQVFAATLVGAKGHPVLADMQFKTVFIDEAAQALEPACWIPILKAQRVIFAGDHCQLPPTIKSFEAAREGLAETLFEKSITRGESAGKGTAGSPAAGSPAAGLPAARMLEVQYRMHQQIMQFSSRKFYGNRLQAHETVKSARLLPDEIPLEFIDTAGSGFVEQKDPESRSTFNQEEARMLMKHFTALVERIGVAAISEQALQIGVISPYKAQVKTLQALFDESELLKPIKEQVDINTVDAFQGQERDIIYISLVRSNDEGEIGFLADERRMNVAMTRARKKLVMFGDTATLGNNSFYNQLLDYVQEEGAYRSVFEMMYE
jgi:ATP-dependent RNA/DNA helicase IGHMBP2